MEFKSLKTIGDCIAGKPNAIYCVEKPILRNSHQYCLSRKSIVKLIDLFKKEFAFSEYQDFESLHSYVSEIYKKLSTEYRLQQIKGDLGALHIYDTSLRIAHVFYPKEGSLSNIIPHRLVYLQAGAYKGAVALQKITRLSREEQKINLEKSRKQKKKSSRTSSSRYRDCYINPDIKLVYGAPIPITDFNCHMQTLGSKHIENFLCIYHRLLEDWAAGYQQYIDDLKVKTLKKSKNKR